MKRSWPGFLPLGILRKRALDRIHIYNCFGNEITVTRPAFRNPKDGYYPDEFATVPIVGWLTENENVDGHGFAKKIDMGNGKHTIRMNLPIGKQICRYGPPTGHCTTDIGTPYEELSLPYLIDTIQYHEYEVIANDVYVYCEVDCGRVYPAFDMIGYGIQYYHINNIMLDLSRGALKEVFSWKK